MEKTNEILAAYAVGNVSETERNAVRQYLVDNPSELETVMMMMDEDYTLGVDDEVDQGFDFNKQLDDLLDEIDTVKPFENSTSNSILPLMAKAAQNNTDNSCAIKCESYALRALGVDMTDEELRAEAEKQGLLKPDGTALYNIGQLSAQHGLFVSRKFDCSINDILKSLKHGDVVIAVIDNTELSRNPEEADRIDRLYGKLPNHALIIQSVDIGKNNITLLNPGEYDKIRQYPLNVFLEAWDDSANYLIISNRNHYNPHPVNLSDIFLEEDLMRLQDVFAENLHEVWAKSRRDEGWSYGILRDEKEKTDPLLLPYDLLPQQEKERCRLMAMESIKLLKKLGWKFTNAKTK